MRFITFIFSFILFHTFLSAQLFVDPANVWNVRTCIDDITTASTSCEYYTVEFQQSPVFIDNIKYFKLKADKGDITNFVVPNGAYYREEDSKVFIKFNATADEELIYDFNLSIGDSVEVNNTILFLESIDSIQLETGEYRKRMKMVYSLNANQNGIHWIEGIGKKDFPLVPTWGVFHLGNTLGCFKSDNTLLWINENDFIKDIACNPFFLNSVEDQDSSSSKLSAYPNPSFDELRIKGLSTNVKSITIYNLHGKAIKTMKQIINQTISIHELNAGSYIISVDYIDGKNAVLKFMKV